MSLHREYHQVLRTDGGIVGGGHNVLCHELTAVMHDELHATSSNRLEIQAAHDKSDLLARKCQLHAHVAADSARADNRDLHRTSCTAMEKLAHCEATQLQCNLRAKNAELPAAVGAVAGAC